MPSCATVTPCPPTQNFVASGTDAVQGSTFPVPVAVAGTSSTAVAACGSASTDVRSMELRYRRLLLVLRVSRQLRRHLPGLDLVRHPARRRRRRRPSVTGRVPARRGQAPPCRHRRLHLRRLPVHQSSSCVSSRQFVNTRGRRRGSCSVTISAASLRSTHGRHLKNRYSF